MQLEDIWPKDVEDQALAGALAVIMAACLLALVWTPADNFLSGLEKVEGVRAAKAVASDKNEGGPDVLAMVQAQPFVMTTGTAAYTEPTLFLSGVSVLPGRKAALISVNGGPANWLVRGQNREGIALVDAGPGWAMIATELGQKRIEIGASASQPEAGE